MAAVTGMNAMKIGVEGMPRTSRRQPGDHARERARQRRDEDGADQVEIPGSLSAATIAPMARFSATARGMRASAIVDTVAWRGT